MIPSNDINGKLIFIVIVSLCYVYLCFAQPVPGTNLGDNCTVAQNISGTCKQLKDCPRSILQINLNKALIYCSNSNEKICCPNLGDISEQKCEEYRQAVIPKTFIKEQSLIIVGDGQNADPNEFPHMALLGYGNDETKNWICGGSLISYQHVLTAAHCSFHSKSGSSTNWVRLGEYNQAQEINPNRIDIKIKEFIKHPLYKRQIKYHDIAIVLLDKRVTFTIFIRPACLNTKQTFPSNTQFIATGWGALGDGGDFANILQKVKLQEFPKNDCQQSYSNKINLKSLPEGITNSLICAGDKHGEKDTCGGDSGGPLQVYHQKMQDMLSIVGITAFGKNYCGAPGIPGVYTRVYDYIEWIENVVWI